MAYGFQSTVYQFSGAGIPGEAANDGPMRVQPAILATPGSPPANPNVFAYAYTWLPGSEGKAQLGNPSGTAAFLGILVNPKGSALYGGALLPSLSLPNGWTGEFAAMGSWWVSLNNNANVGDWVIFDNTTGALSSVAPGTALATGKTALNAIIDYYNVTATATGKANAVITLTQLPGIPVAALVSDTYVDPEGNQYTDETGDDYIPPMTAAQKRAADKAAKDAAKKAAEDIENEGDK